MAGYLTSRFNGPDRRVFLPGETTAGHYQIELSCNACHTPGMGVREEACYECHAEELKLANDSHPKSKFTDPRNADLLKVVRADHCVSCHREHVPDQTHAMGVTMPGDYCFHCHQRTLDDVASHRDLPFDSCATAGCHNYHDNTALYKDFLLRHANQPATRDSAVVPARGPMELLAEGRAGAAPEPLGVDRQDAPAGVTLDAGDLHEWASTRHAQAGVNCTDCHALENPATGRSQWSDRLDHAACVKCHDGEVNGFLAGKHGMRLAQKLSPMTPGMARLPMKAGAAHRDLNCVSCHGAHGFDARAAAVDACLSCHNDSHSLAYRESKHFVLWQSEQAGGAPAGSGVSCATCHLPRETHGKGADATVRVQHNQNANLRPNEKMIRGVCIHCHSLEFSLDALADPALVENNFVGRPQTHVESIDMALRRQMEIRNKKPNP